MKQKKVLKYCFQGQRKKRILRNSKILTKLAGGKICKK